MKNPCYDTNTKRDCPDRKPGCAINCPEWASYVDERDKIYKRRRNDREIKDGIKDAKRRVKSYRR